MSPEKTARLMPDCFILAASSAIAGCLAEAEKDPSMQLFLKNLAVSWMREANKSVNRELERA